jgi:mono/diheme cytochrome c family protein
MNWPIPCALSRRTLASLGIAAMLFAGRSAWAKQPADAKVDFARDIRPIFARHCFKCHGSDEEEGGLRLDERKRALEGGASGPPLVPGKSGDSLIYQFITGRNEDKIIMPPKGKGQRLSAEQCELVRRWIDQGAVWPEKD